MNISELARQLKMPSNKLREMLPEMGFDIGAKAIKIDNYQAQRIARDWSRLKADYERKKQEAIEKVEVKKEVVAKSVILPAIISVRDLSAKLNTPVSQVMGELMRNGILTTLNEKIDYETAAIIAQSFNFDSQKEQVSSYAEVETMPVAMIEEDKANLKPRPPVIVVMGHVDHGKTKLLDAIRETNVMGGEAGGITQHIGAYQVVWTNKKSQEKRKLTFIDTPGHAAFMAMRSRGAKIADIAILIVAADDGVQPQTEEAYNIIKAAAIPFVVVINKIDKEGANPELIKQQLGNLGLIPEAWGGKVPFVEVSAKQGLNIDALLDILLLVSDMEGDKIKSNPDGLASGTIVESHIDQGEGPVATVLVQKGTLKKGDNLTVGGNFYGRVRALKNWAGKNIEEALPSTPVRVLGLKTSLQVGDIIKVVDIVKSADRRVKQNITAHSQMIVTQKMKKDSEGVKFLNVIIKTDVIGSLEALMGMVEKLRYPTVAVDLVAKGLGNITEADIFQAMSSKAVIYGFNVDLSPSVFNLAREKGIAIEKFNIIYDLINNIKARLEDLLDPEIIRIPAAKFATLALFRSEKDKHILGGRCEEGTIAKGFKADILRKGALVGNGKITEVRFSKDEVKEATSGQECGIKFESKDKVREGDVLDIYREESKKRKLE